MFHASELAQRLIRMIGWGNAALLEELAVELLQGDGAQEIVVPLIAHVLLAAAPHHHIVAHIVYELDDPSLGTSPLPDARFLIQHPLIVVEHLLVGTGSQLVVLFSCHRRIILEKYDCWRKI